MVAQGFIPDNGIGFKSLSWAAIQALDVAQNVGLAFYCPDAPRGASCVVSDGIRWRPFAIGLYREAYTLQAADNGIHNFTYNQGWVNAPAPGIILVDSAGGAGRLSYNISNATNNGCTVTVSRGVTLPNTLTLLTQLIGFNTWAGGSVTGVTIFLIAFSMEN